MNSTGKSSWNIRFSKGYSSDAEANAISEVDTNGTTEQVEEKIYDAKTFYGMVLDEKRNEHVSGT